jgi:hypothetical protein
MLLKNKEGVRQWDIELVLDVEVLNQEQKYGSAKIVHLKVILLVFLMVVVVGLVLVDALDVEVITILVLAILISTKGLILWNTSAFMTFIQL